VRVSPSDGLYADATDTVAGIDGNSIATQATIWPMARGVSDDFAARIAWTVSASRTAANHPPEPVINGQSGLAPIEVTSKQANPSYSIHWHKRSRRGRSTLHWFEYTDLNQATPHCAAEPQNNTATQVRVTAPRSTIRSQHHIILEVQDTGTRQSLDIAGLSSTSSPPRDSGIFACGKPKVGRRTARPEPSDSLG